MSAGTRSRTSSKLEETPPGSIQSTVKKKIPHRSRTVSLTRSEISDVRQHLPGITQTLNMDQHQGMKHSTPAVSPHNTVRTEFQSPLPRDNFLPNDEMDAYSTTPLAQSQGARFVPTELPSLTEVSTILEMNDHLDAIYEKIEAYSTKHGDEINWKTEIHPAYKAISAKINSIRLLATDKCNDVLVARCSELFSKLEEAKIKWSAKAHSESSLHSFHGFSSFEGPRTNLPAGESNPLNGSQVIRVGDLVKRISDVESMVPSLMEMRSILPQVNQFLTDNVDVFPEIIQRIATLENTAQANIENGNLTPAAAVQQIENLEARFNQLSNGFDSQKSICDQAADAQRSLVKELTTFKTSISDAVDNLQLAVDQLILNAQTQCVQDLHPNVNTSVSQDAVIPPTYLNKRATDRVINGNAAIQNPGNSNLVSQWLHSQQGPINHSGIPGIPPIAPVIHQNQQVRSSLPNPAPGMHVNNVIPPTPVINNGKSNDDSVSSSIESATPSSLDIQGRLLRTQMKSLRTLLSPSLDQPIPKCTLEDIYRNRISAIEGKERELSKSLQYYLRSQICNIQLCEQLTDVIEDATNYVSGIRALYVKEGHHMKSQSAKLYEALPKFTSQSDIHIFEFLKRYDAIAKDFDIPSEKAELLYSKFLCPSIQEEIVRYKGDYNAMRTMLLQRYGNLKTITNNAMLSLSKEFIPGGGQDVSIQVAYYRKLQFAFQKINKLLSSPDVPIQEVEDYLFSNDFITHVMLYLPQEAENDFIRQLQRLDEDTIRIRGKTAFKVLLATVNQYYEMYDTSARNKSSSAKSPNSGHKKDKTKLPKHAHIVEATTYSSDESVPDVDREPISSSVHFQQNDLKQNRPPKPASSLKFPCIIEGHNHSLGECEEFFQKSPKERVEHKKQFKFKYCTLCLQSTNECQFNKCANTKAVPKHLKCKDCKEIAKAKKRSWYSVLFCFAEKHSKPSNDDIIKALDEYVPTFKSAKVKNPVNIACHFKVLQSSKKICSKPQTLSRAVNPEEPVPMFNTRTGVLESPHETDVIKEVNEDSIGIMQMLNIQGKTVLTMFDSGANQNLMDGSLAEELQIKVISDEPSAIGVISGGQIWTEYGQYQLALGPTQAGAYFEIKAQGISSVTGTFPQYDLAEVNRDVREHSDLTEDTILPSYIGGDKIKLLIGLKNAQIEPVCLFTLPSGLGIYRSPFTDMFGSNICFGGPHSSFSSVNKMLSSNINHFNAFLLQTLYQYSNSFYPSLIRVLKPEPIEGEDNIMHYKEPILPYSFQTSSGQNVYPTALSCQDFIELGQQVEDEIKTDTEICPGPHCECTDLCYAFKARVPLSKQREFIDEEDIDSSEGYRCSKCARCRCSTNNRFKMMSLNDTVEQAAIEKSVTINLDEKKVYVDLPFTKPPGDFLTERHGGDNNYSQALRVYKSQCRLPESRKDGIRTVHADLVDKGFLKKITDLPQDHQNLIKNSVFKHYMAWRCVMKESASTPIRVVVDPSQSGLNLILAKGENRLSKINDIWTRARTKKYIWSSDISKLYNRLHLKPTSYAYQLFLYHNKLDPDTPPEIYVMVVAWYGVTPSSNQSGFALEELARLFKIDYPRAYKVIMKERYVDDLLAGSNSKEEVLKQIEEVKYVLSCGGFSTKFVIQSGVPEEGEDILKVLGYKWHIEDDKLSPGFSELNFNAKKRGVKSPNPFPVANPDDVSKLLSSKNISRRMVISKIAELWEPAGYFEPYKVQLKLAAQALNGLDWDSPLALDLQEHWIVRFQEFLTIPNLRISRYMFPSNINPEGKIRLLCISDAACSSGGAAVYAGVKLPDGTYTCQLLGSRSKLMNESIPRNELNAIRIGANFVYDVKNALGDDVAETFYFTDSFIAMAWVHNTKKKLRLYCLNRVTEIRNLILSGIESSSDIPLYHIDGKRNIADLLTKPNNIKPEDIGENSTWIQGYDWMKNDFCNMPVTSFSQLQLTAAQNQSITQEYFPDIYLPSVNATYVNGTDEDFGHCSGCRKIHGSSILICYGISEHNPHCVECDCKVKFFSFLSKAAKDSSTLIDIIKHGYQKSISVIARVIDFTWSIKHKMHQSRGALSSQTCKKCAAISESGGIELEYAKILKRESLDYFLRTESKNLEDTLSKDRLKKFTLKDGVYYYMGRLPEDAQVSTKDLDQTVFFDNTEISGILPVISADSPFFFAYLIHIHHKVRKHSGTEITMREVMKSFYVISNPRRIIQAVRKNCPRCRIIIRKTLELEMAHHPQSRLQIAPPFYHVMMDIVYGFKGKVFKRSRTEVKIYGLVIVCLMTSATNILALEGIESQDIIQAIERHSSRYGVPAAMYVDQGTQFTCLEGVEVRLRDIHAQLRESVGIEVIPSAPKSHEARGRIERKILTLREMLLKTAIDTDIGLTAIQWDSIFAKMSNEIDEVPIARNCKSTNSDYGWDLLTPNRFKLGRSNQRSLQGPIYLTEKSTPVDILEKAEKIQKYWYQLLLDRLHHLIPRPAKWTSTDEIKVNDVVIFRFLDNQNTKLETWKLGRIAEILNEGRRVSISYIVLSNKGKKQKATTHSVVRCPRDVCIISAVSELDLNSKEFFDRVKKIT